MASVAWEYPGDLVRTDLPVALMERAATTGFLAANALLERWGVRGQILWTVPDRGRVWALRAVARLAGGQPGKRSLSRSAQRRSA